MSLIDWVIILIPLAFVMGLGIYSHRYVKGVVDYLSAGRVCGRYVICIGDIANALSIIGLVSYVEVHYRTGFALSFWNNLLLPLSIFMGLTGFCVYRFRETKAMSLGQFLEMRYSRSFRIFAASLRSLSEMLANMIMPAIAARFFISFLNLPLTVDLWGWSVPTFMLVVVTVLCLSLTLICSGGTLTLLVTDAVQGLICYPLMVVFVIFILYKFSWSGQLVPVMMDRASGENFINPYDIDKLRDFNLFTLVVTLFGTVLHRASWIGAGYSTAAKTPHEQKMAGMLGTWRNTLMTMLYVLISVSILTLLNHKDFADESKVIRDEITNRVAQEIVQDPGVREKLTQRVAALEPHQHTIGQDPPLSEEANLDTRFLDTAHETLLEGAQDEQGEAQANAKFQEFRTLYHQLMMAFTMRHLLPTGMLGMFCLLMALAMISTDDTRIFSSALTITQDVVLPLRKKPFTPRQHIWAIRLVSIGVGVFFLLGSFFMAQLDYITLFVTIAVSLWMGGCGPVMIFGLYGRFGTTAGAWASLLNGMFLSTAGILVQRNWASSVYPWLNDMGWVEPIGNFLATISRPLNPYIVWEMNPVKFPINSYEIYFLTMILSLVLYIVVSYLTMREPFNMDRMLHRGKYNLDGENKAHSRWTPRTVFSKLIGITPEYTLGDKAIAWGVFLYSFGYIFCGAFVGVVIWNAYSRWPLSWWGHYFFVVFLVVPGCVAAFSAVWFGYGGVRDMFRMFRDLNAREINHLDDGRVDGHISVADKARIEALEKGQKP